MILLRWATQSIQIHKDRRQNSGCQGCGEGELGLFNGFGTSVPHDEESSEDQLHADTNVLNTTGTYN